MRKAALLFAFTLSLSGFADDVAGKWKVVAKDSGGEEIKADLSLKQEDGKLTGTMALPDATLQLKDVQFKENVLTYHLEHGGMPVSVKMTLDGGKLKGNYTVDGGETRPIEAERVVEAAAAPASPVIGDWKVSTTGPDGEPLKLVITLKQTDGKWSGQLVIEEHDVTLPLSDIKVDGSSFTCNVETDGGTFVIEAKIADDKLEGSHTSPDGKKNKMAGTR